MDAYLSCNIYIVGFAFKNERKKTEEMIEKGVIFN